MVDVRKGSGSGMKMEGLHYSWSQRRRGGRMDVGWDMFLSIHMDVGVCEDAYGRNNEDMVLKMFTRDVLEKKPKFNRF